MFPNYIQTTNMIKFTNLHLFICIFSCLQASAQSRSITTMYAMTASADNEFAWLNIESIDLQKTNRTQEVFNKNNHKFVFSSIRASAEIQDKISTYTHDFFNPAFPTANMSCAIACSPKTGRIYFFPLGKNELNWIERCNSADSAKSFGSVTSSSLLASGNTYPNDPGNVTRATIGANGRGYAITNDGQHLYEFTDDLVPVITDRGALIDHPENKKSVYEEEYWGGDIAAMSDNNLLLVTGNGNIFSIDITTKQTKLIFRIKGLQKKLIVTGVAVDEQNQLVVAGSHGWDGFYKVAINGEAIASKIPNTEKPYSVSDLTSPNLLTLYKKTPVDKTITASVFPNPILNNSFKIQLENAVPGKYRFRIYDQYGKQVEASEVLIGSGKFTSSENIHCSLSSGIYYFSIFDLKGQVISREKILVSN